MNEIDPVKIQVLVDLRKAVRPRLSQTAVAKIFGLDPKYGRKTIGSWENGEFGPDENQRRTKFIGYLWDTLGLRKDPEQFEAVWQLLVEQWRWLPISDDEWASFTNVPRPLRTEELAASAAPILSLPIPEPARPPDVTGFVGRQRELSAYSELITQSRIAVIAGTVGAGKTALAAQLATQQGTADRIFWHNCYPEHDAYDLIWRLAEFLGWRGQREIWDYLNVGKQSDSLPPASSLFDSIFEVMRSEDFILCFDNFHWIHSDASQRELVERLLTAAKSEELILIATTQQAIDLGGTIPEPLAGLNLDDARLFLNTRGIHIAPELTETLHHRTEGNAALLTLSAQAVEKATNPESLIDQLVNTDEVEQFLLKEIDELLEDDERLVMSGVAALLGYPGTVDAIEEVLDEDGVRRSLVHLSNRYLLEKHLNEDANDVSYSQHDIVRKFYYQLLGRSGRSEMHRRAAEYYEEEIEDSFLAALHYQHARDHEKAAELATQQVFANLHSGRAPALQTMLTKFSAEKLPPERWVQVLIARGHTDEFSEAWESALESYQEALHLLKALPDLENIRTWQIEAHRGIVIVLRYRRPEEALTWIEKGLEVATGDDAIAEADLLIQKGAVFLRTQNSEAGGPLEQAIALLDIYPNHPKVARLKRLARLNLGIHLYYKNKLEEAGQHWLKAIQLAEATKDIFNGLSLRINLAALYHITGPYEIALDYYKDAQKIATQFGKQVEIARIQCNMGALQIMLSDYSKAEQELNQSLHLARTIEQTEIEATALTYLGDLHLRQEQPQEALPFLQEAEKLSQENGLAFQQPTIFRLIAEYHLTQGNLKQAKDLSKQAVDLAHEYGIQIEEGAALRVLGETYAQLNILDDAKKSFEQSIELLQNNPYELKRTLNAHKTYFSEEV